MYRETREWSTEEYWYFLKLGSLDWRMYILNVRRLGGRMEMFVVVVCGEGEIILWNNYSICQDKAPRL